MTTSFDGQLIAGYELVAFIGAGGMGDAESGLQRAIETARARGARTFELRATTALGRLWAGRNQRDKAHALLETTCDALGDAEDTIDVRRARACLREWS
jgi:hypothetical protein